MAHRKYAKKSGLYGSLFLVSSTIDTVMMFPGKIDMLPLKFNETDVAANREGRLTDAQRKRINAYREAMDQQGKLLVQILATMIIFVFAGVQFIIFVTEHYSLSEIIESILRTLPIPAFCIAVYVIGMRLMNAISRRKLTQESVQTALGTAQFATHRAGNKTFYRLFLRTPLRSYLMFQFEESESLSNFDEGQAYRVYYLRGLSPYLLSAECLTPDELE
jgi:hypothetical protein